MEFFSRIFITAAAMAGFGMAASALTLAVEPGEVRQAVTAACDPSTETSLTLTGALDAADFDFLREMTALRTLDLGGATVAAYDGAKTATGLTSSPAGVLPDCALMSGSFTSVTLPSGITRISAGALGGSKAQTVVIPATVTRIDDGAFAGMENLRSVTVPASVTSLGRMAFKDCTSLETVRIDAPLTALPSSTFQNCPALATVTLPSSMTSIGEGAFAGCKGLKGIALPSSLKRIGARAFAATGLEEIDLSADRLTTIGDWAFAGCASLATISAGSSLDSIGKGAFYNDARLNVTLGQLAANLTEIPDYLLYGAENATTEGFDDTPVETVGNYALSGLKDQRVALPGGLSQLGDGAMERWQNLREVDGMLLSQVPATGESVWDEVDQGSAILWVPTALYSEFKDAPQWQDFDVRTETSSSVDEIVITDSDNGGLKAAFDGMLLMLEAPCDIRAAQLYDISGRCFTIAQNFQSNRLTVDTAPFDARVFIVRVLLSDGKTPVLKLVR